jgi:hypothetical protein
MFRKLHISTLLVPLLISTTIIADESLLGSVKGSETLPQGAFEFDQTLTYRETHGDEVREQQWREHFTDKTVNDAFKLNDDIPNITGATLSARNVTDGVKRLLALHQVVLSDE